MGATRTPKAKSLFPMQVSPMDFKVGDAVKKLTPNHVSDTVGVVTHLLPKTFKIRVQWPYGNEVEAPEEIYKVDPKTFPPTVTTDTSYSSHENAESEKAYGAVHKKEKRTAKIAHAVSEKHFERLSFLESEANTLKVENELSSLNAYVQLSQQYGSKVGDDVIRGAITSVYGK